MENDTDVPSNHTLSEIMRKSQQIDPKLVEKYMNNRAIEEPAYTALIVMYSLLIILGTLGNTLVVISVVRKPTMRTPRNMFIVNLAMSDLLLCMVVMPLTLMEILTQYFPLGNSVLICKSIGTLEATSVFVSTISITAIALDRYQVIVYPTKESLQLVGAVLILGFIWVLALILAAPIFIIMDLKNHQIQLGNGVDEINFCIENWPMDHGRAFYSIFSLIMQYLVPIIIVSVVYLRISYKLRCRFATGFVSSEEASTKSRRQLRGRRLQRTNILLASIAIIFCVSWLPLNLFNLIADLSSGSDYSSQRMRILFAVCHMMGMSSACSNPVLYGCLNENFWKEFKDILCFSKEPGESVGESHQRVSLRRQFQKVLGKGKGELSVGVGAATEYQACNSASTDMTVLTKC